MSSIDSHSIINYVDKNLPNRSDVNFAQLASIQQSCSELRQCLADQSELAAMLGDQAVEREMKELANNELNQLRQEELQLASVLGSLLIPEEKYDKENALLEVPVHNTQ
jgi:protein subunit release factor A